MKKLMKRMTPLDSNLTKSQMREQKKIGMSHQES